MSSFHKNRTFPKLSSIACLIATTKTRQVEAISLYIQLIQIFTTTHQSCKCCHATILTSSQLFFFFIISIQRFSFHLSFTFLAFFRSALRHRKKHIQKGKYFIERCSFYRNDRPTDLKNWSSVVQQFVIFVSQSAIPNEYFSALCIWDTEFSFYVSYISLFGCTRKCNSWYLF